jgi:hypothetical protein
MHIQDIRETYQQFERYNLDYQEKYFRFAESNRRVGEATQNLFLSWFPWWMHSALKPATLALLDDGMLDAFGFEHPDKFLRNVVANSLKIRALLLRLFPPLLSPNFYIDSPIRSYPHGYEIANVGAMGKED